MSSRQLVRMTDDEVTTFLGQECLVTCATMSSQGRPHVMPMFYVSEAQHVLCFTYTTSQKVRNLRRDPRATLQVEAGRQYNELRGVMMECDALLIDDPDEVRTIGLRLAARTALREDLDAEAEKRGRAIVTQQSLKRTGVRFVPTRIVSWDHRKS